MVENKSALEKLGGIRGIVLWLLAFAVLGGTYRWQSVSSGNAMKEVGAELGLDYFEEGQRRQLRGRIDGIGVAVDTTTENSGGDTRWFTDFKVYAPDQPHVRIIGASLRQKAIGGIQGSEWLETGDAAFDGEVLIEGTPETILGRLTENTRPTILSATDAGWELDALTWKARKTGRISNSSKIRSTLEAGLAVARALSETEGTVAPTAPVEDRPVENPAATSTTTSPAPPLSTDDKEALAEVNTPRSLDVALRLAKSGDLREEVKKRLILAIISRQRLAEVISVLGEGGGPADVFLLSSIKGEHEEAAKAAIKAIEARQ